MRALLFATAAAILPAAAYADTIINGITYLDPTAFHVTSSIATGSDPVLLNNTSAFSVQDISNATIDQPLTIYFAELPGFAAPVVTAASYTVAINHTQFVTTPITGPFPTTFIGTNVGGTVFAPPDLYTFVGCVACNNSIGSFNIQDALVVDGLIVGSSLAPTLDVYSVTIPQGFVGQDQVNITGVFANGTVIAPLAENVDTKHNTVTFFDTSWTNAGFTNCSGASADCGTTPPPPPPPIAEPSSLAVLGAGLVGLGLLGGRWRSGLSH